MLRQVSGKVSTLSLTGSNIFLQDSLLGQTTKSINSRICSGNRFSALMLMSKRQRNVRRSPKLKAKEYVPIFQGGRDYFLRFPTCFAQILEDHGLDFHFLFNDLLVPSSEAPRNTHAKSPISVTTTEKVLRSSIHSLTPRADLNTPRPTRSPAPPPRSRNRPPSMMDSRSPSMRKDGMI